MVKKMPRGKPFKKGDPRINRKGRPKSFDALKALALQIAHEVAKSGDVEIILMDAKGKQHKVTVAEAILRKWASSSDPKLQTRFIEIAFGKVPDIKQFQGADGEDIRIELIWAKYADDKKN